MIGAGGLFTTIAIITSVPEGTIAFRAAIDVGRREVRLDQVADLSAVPIPLRDRADAMIVAIIPSGQSAIAPSSRELAERARARLPGLSDWLGTVSDARIPIRLTTVPNGDTAEDPGQAVPISASVGTCRRVVHALAPGDAVSPTHIEPAPCTASAVTDAFRYDGLARVARSRKSLSPGRIVRPLPDGTLAGVVVGQDLDVVAHVGAVTVRRSVLAVQSARPRQPVFVRSRDGAVFAVPAPETTR